jgi:hypothetical protein
MHLPDDDELYEVDQTYLGPPRRYIAPMRHKAIFAWLVIGPLTFVVAHKLGLPFTVLSVGLLLFGTMWVAMTLADKATHEKPITSLFAAFWHDLAAPRGKRRSHQTTSPTRPRTHLGRKRT